MGCLAVLWYAVNGCVQLCTATECSSECSLTICVVLSWFVVDSDALRCRVAQCKCVITQVVLDTTFILFPVSTLECAVVNFTAVGHGGASSHMTVHCNAL